MGISRPQHVFPADIPYIPMKRGVVYLLAVVDWASRHVLAWRLSNTLTTDFCIEVPQEAIHRYGKPDSFNTGRRSHSTSRESTQLLKENGIAISMGGRGCWRDHVFVERLWNSIRYEEVCLLAYKMVNAAQSGIARYIDFYFYNSRRLHGSLDGMTPDAFYITDLPAMQRAAKGNGQNP